MFVCSDWLILSMPLPALAELSNADVSMSETKLVVPAKANSALPVALFQSQIEMYSRLLEKNSRNIDAYNNRGVFKAQLGDIKGAMADFKAVLEIKPSDPEAFNNLGNCLASSGNYAQAIDYFTQAIKSDPQHVSSYFGRGRLRRALGDRAGADVDLRVAARIYLQRGQEDSYREVMNELQTPLVYQ